MIVLTRIDNRLIHGQVATGWLRSCGANIVIVANDRVAANPMEQQLLSMAVASLMPVRFLTVDEAAKKVARADPRRKIALIVENPVDALGLVEGGLSLKSINVGNMHMAEGKTCLCKTVYADEREIDASLGPERGHGGHRSQRVLTQR